MAVREKLCSAMKGQSQTHTFCHAHVVTDANQDFCEVTSDGAFGFAAFVLICERRAAVAGCVVTAVELLVQTGIFTRYTLLCGHNSAAIPTRGSGA